MAPWLQKMATPNRLLCGCSKTGFPGGWQKLLAALWQEEGVHSRSAGPGAAKSLLLRGSQKPKGAVAELAAL